MAKTVREANSSLEELALLQRHLRSEEDIEQALEKRDKSVFEVVLANGKKFGECTRP
jgi:hypothetical protein